VVVADFLIHVLDVTNPDVARHHVTTLAVLAELGAERRRSSMFQQDDIADPRRIESARILAPGACSSARRPGPDWTSSWSIARCVARDFASTELLVPHDRYDVISRLHEVGHIHARNCGTTAYISLVVPGGPFRDLRPFLVPAPSGAGPAAP